MQSPLTVIARIKPADLKALATLLDKIGDDPNGTQPNTCNTVFPFGRLSLVHFARFVIIPNAADSDKSLYYESIFDESLDQHLDQIIAKIGSGVDEVWGKCEDYPAEGVSNPAAFKQFIRSHALQEIVFYTAYPDETAHQVKADSRIRAALEDFLNETPVARFLNLLAQAWK